MLKSVNKLKVSFFVAVIMMVSACDNAARQENKQLGAEFLLKNKAEKGVETTASGLQYKVLSVGSGTVHPKGNDYVTVHYEGRLLNGMVFDSSSKRGKPLSFALDQVIPGWTEGVQLMVVGQKTRFFIPHDLAYGDRSAGKIPPGSTLIFDVELLRIER